MTIDDRLIHKPCPKPDCTGELIVRGNSTTGDKFLGCSRFPACRHTEDIPEYLRMIAAGTKMLPGFDL